MYNNNMNKLNEMKMFQNIDTIMCNKTRGRAIMKTNYVNATFEIGDDIINDASHITNSKLTMYTNDQKQITISYDTMMHIAMMFKHFNNDDK